MAGNVVGEPGERVGTFFVWSQLEVHKLFGSEEYRIIESPMIQRLEYFQLDNT